ncbi:MAG: UvrD-helicase domain-containing protein [Mediterraneibacter gnavus]
MSGRRGTGPSAPETVGEEFLGLTGVFSGLNLEDSLMDFPRRGFCQGIVKTEKLNFGKSLLFFKFRDLPLLSRMEAILRTLQRRIWETLYNRRLSEEEEEKLSQEFMGMYATRDLYVLYSQLLEESGFAPLPHVSYEKRVLAYEDVYPMLYLKYRLYQKKGQKNIKHLVIDEMQDYSFLQYTILAELFPCKMTILGDCAQTMEEQQQDVLKFLPGILGRHTRTIVMNKSYRNTVEIARYANRLAGLTDMELLGRLR